jgi:hypothetical protein
MRGELAEAGQGKFDAFMEGAPLSAADLLAGGASSLGRARSNSAQLDLSPWSNKTGSNVLVMIAVNPRAAEEWERAQELAERAIKGMRGCRIVCDTTGESPLRGVAHPARQAGMAAIRQGMIDRHLRDERWVFWADADIVEYPENLIDELIARVEGGVAAPLILMEGDASEPTNAFGFGPGRFYDVAGFVEKGRWARFEQPYFDQPGPVYLLDSVGSCYLVNADLYRHGGKHVADPASQAFIASGAEWHDRSIADNQAAPANCFTEHYSLCLFARENGLPVQAFADLIACHARP